MPIRAFLLVQRQRRRHALQPVGARAFDQHCDAAGERFARFRDERVDAREPLAAAAERLDRKARAFADCEQTLDAGLARIAPDLGVQTFGARAQLAHFAEHQPAHAAEAAERIEAGLERAGIGVVRVVDQEGAVQRGLQLQPARDTLRRGETCDDLIELDADGARSCSRTERIAQVVQAAERERRRPAAIRRHELELRAEASWRCSPRAPCAP